jgi:hypothetical protein
MPAVLVQNMTSLPNTQAPIMENPTADKKRNKLGYHRTSVACGEWMSHPILLPVKHTRSFFYSHPPIKCSYSGAIVHCRRRKIRCLVAADDPQGRCENCIRLRKECQFFPVDQQPPVEKKSRPNSRLESASTDPSTTSSSPPTMGGGADHSESYFPYQPMPLDASQDASGFHATSFPSNPMSSFVPGRQTDALVLTTAFC